MYLSNFRKGIKQLGGKIYAFNDLERKETLWYYWHTHNEGGVIDEA